MSMARVCWMIFIFLAALTLLTIYSNHECMFVKTAPAAPQRRSPPGKQSSTLSKINCLKKKFRDILLVIVYNYPYYDTIPLLTRLYRPLFRRIIFCGPPGNSSHHVITVDVRRGILGYECLGRTIREHPGYEGYFYINDDVILNYWNLREFNTSRLWESPFSFSPANMTGPIPRDWYWWISPYGLINCRQACEKIANTPHNNPNKHAPLQWTLAFLYVNSKSRLKCFSGRSDIFFVPREHAQTFAGLALVFYEHKVFLEIAVPTIFRLLDLEGNIGRLPGYYIPGDVRKGDPRVTDSRFFWSVYFWKQNEWFIHPFKLHHSQLDNKLNQAMLKYFLIEKGKALPPCP